MSAQQTGPGGHPGEHPPAPRGPGALDAAARAPWDEDDDGRRGRRGRRLRPSPGALAGGVAVVGAVAVLVAAGAVALVGPTASVPLARAAQVGGAAQAAAVQQPLASDVLAGIAVKGKGPFTGYSRAQFGEAWVDVDRNGCSTREDVLRRDLTDVVLKRGSVCDVASGTLDEPYGGQVVAFTRGSQTSALVQIDHVVALADAWKTGAAGWTPEQRLAFANDPLNLVAVDGDLNQEKKAGDAATWLPPDASYRCAYVARQVAVKAAYGLSVTAAERDAVQRVLATCPGQRVPAATDPA